MSVNTEEKLMGDRSVNKKILVFTDLDGSLLDHENYSWSKAKPALSALKEQGCPVIYTSSKTAAEIIQLKNKTENYYPFISENGAVVGIPKHCLQHDMQHDFSKQNVTEMQAEQYHFELFSQSYESITRILSHLRETYQFQFRGFNDMSVQDIMLETGLNKIQAENAKQREASEPFLWMDTGDAFNQFKQELLKHLLGVTSGGRFYHAMSDVSKGNTVSWLINKYQKHLSESCCISIGLGDGFNDLQMLEVVDYPVLIPNPKARQPDVSHIKNIFVPDYHGPEGWSQAILHLLNKIQKT